MTVDIDSAYSLAVAREISKRLVTAQEARRRAIIATVSDGHSLRAVAEAAGVSHETVRSIVTQAKREKV